MADLFADIRRERNFSEFFKKCHYVDFVGKETTLIPSGRSEFYNYTNATVQKNQLTCPYPSPRSPELSTFGFLVERSVQRISTSPPDPFFPRRRWDDARIVRYQKVSGIQILHNVSEAAMFNCALIATQYHEARGIPRLYRRLGYKLLREEVII